MESASCRAGDPRALTAQEPVQCHENHSGPDFLLGLAGGGEIVGHAFVPRYRRPLRVAVPHLSAKHVYCVSSGKVNSSSSHSYSPR